MAVKPTAPRVMSGTFGMLYMNGDPIFEVNSFNAKLKVNRETVTFAGEMMENSKMVGNGGEFTFKVKKIYSRAHEIAQRMQAGEDPRMTFMGVLSDPDAYGSERLVLTDCWFGDLSLMDFETGKLLEEEFTGGFSGYSFPDSVSAQ